MTNGSVSGDGLVLVKLVLERDEVVVVALTVLLLVVLGIEASA